MPQKPKYTREEIIAKAEEIVNSSGISSLSARNLAKELNCAISPIFTVFSSMDEVKEELLKKIKTDFLAYLYEALNYQPAFKEFGLRYASYARDHANLYLALINQAHQNHKYSVIDDEIELKNALIRTISETFGLSVYDSVDLFEKAMHSNNALSYYMATSDDDLDDEALSVQISELCIGLVVLKEIQNNNLNIEKAKAMVNATGNKPRHK